jgi:hypothetical protein
MPVQDFALTDFRPAEAELSDHFTGFGKVLSLLTDFIVTLFDFLSLVIQLWKALLRWDCRCSRVRRRKYHQDI